MSRPATRGDLVALLFDNEVAAYDDAAAIAECILAAFAVRTRPVRVITRRFLPAHAYVVFLLSETAGTTHTRLERLWARKTARAGALAWPFVSGSGLRTRVAELVEWGLVEWSGEMGRTVANRPSKVWRLTGSLVTQIPGFEPSVYDVLRRLRAEAGSDLVTVAAIEAVAAAAGVKL